MADCKQKMKLRKKLLFLCITAVLVLFATNSLQADSLFKKYESGINGSYDRLIVKFKSFTPNIYKDKIYSDYDLKAPKHLRNPNTYSVQTTKDGFNYEKLQKNLFVEYVEPDYKAQGFVVPNDPFFLEQWALENIQAPSAWDVIIGSNEVDIAIVDTGIDGNHPDLSGKVAVSVDCRDNSDCPSIEPSDVAGHGTHVAGIISAVTDNSIGVAGTVWDARLMSVKVLDDDETGYYSWIADGIVWATDNGAEIINLSLGGRRFSRTLKNAVEYAWDNGVVVVAAAGNSGSSMPSYPAYYSEAIAVGATDEFDNLANFSSYGSWVDVAAPGENIISTYQSGYEFFSGTSMSTAFVSGVAGLVFAKNPTWNNSQIRTQLEETCDEINSSNYYFRHGRINTCRALGCDLFVQPTETPEPSPTNTPTPTSTSTPTFTPMPTPTNTPTPTPTPIIEPLPTPTPSLPWWCRYIPWHRMCQ